MSVQRHYPMQGSKKYETTSMPITKSFRVDLGAQAATSWASQLFHQGDMILGFQAKWTEALTSAADAITCQVGFTGTTMLSAATASATLVANYVLGPDHTADASPYVLAADDYFDIIIPATATASAGKFDVHVTYVPTPDGVCDSTFKEYVTT